MAWTAGQGTVGPTAVKLGLVIPAGPCSVQIANVGTATPVYIGFGTLLSSSNGFPVPSGVVSPLVLTGFQGSAAQSVYGIGGTVGAGNIAWIVSTATGGTGL